jgi:hypothetical protein
LKNLEKKAQTADSCKIKKNKKKMLKDKTGKQERTFYFDFFFIPTGLKNRPSSLYILQKFKRENC